MRKYLILFFAFLASMSVVYSQDTSSLSIDKYRKEWGKSYKRTYVEIRKVTKVSSPVDVKVLAVKNLSTKTTYYYVIFEGYNSVDLVSPSIRGIINDEELDEVIAFWKDISEYIKDTTLKYYTEYEYQDVTDDMSFGAFFDLSTRKWKLFFKIDALGSPKKYFFLKPENISDLYSALLNSKVMITQMKASE